MYSIHTLLEYQEVMQLRNEFGWGAKRISSFLLNKGIHINLWTINGWIYCNKRPSEERTTKNTGRK